MRTVLMTAALLIALPCGLLAGEPASHKGWNAGEKSADKKYAEAVKAGLDKAGRIAWVQRSIREEAEKLANAEKWLAQAKSAGDADRQAKELAGVEHFGARKQHKETELQWLEGKLTMAAAEATVKAAEEALAKAGEADKPKAQAALDQARKELETVKALEARGDF